MSEGRPRTSRRALSCAAGAFAVAAIAGGCRECAAPPREQRPSGAAPPAPAGAPGWDELELSPAEAPPEGQRVLVSPRRGGPDAPLVVALHGRGEAGRGLATGARAWRDDYRVDAADAALLAGRIEPADLGGFVTRARLDALRASIAASPYRGVVLATPYTPVVRDRSLAGAAAFAAFVVDVLLPRVEALRGSASPRARTGVDGVSMGGRLALFLGALHPERFASVGALQPAISPGEAEEIADALAAAHRRAPVTIRLVSSEEDPFLDAVRALDAALARRALPATLVVTPGPHDYAWNRGPGAVELLLHHERVLRGLPPP